MEKPFALFQDWFQEAQTKEPSFPDAMTVASISSEGFPTHRVVLLKKMYVDENNPLKKRGLIFFTNMNSSKSQDLLKNPRTSLCFHWKSLAQQVRIEGLAHRLSEQEADEYFSSRPRQSQIGAWASDQSAPLDSKESLEKKVDEYSDKFKDQEVPRPPHWSGFLVEPHYFEFWTEKPYRLHERRVFSLKDGQWAEQLLFP